MGNEYKWLVQICSEFTSLKALHSVSNYLLSAYYVSNSDDFDWIGRALSIGNVGTELLQSQAMLPHLHVR